MNAKGDDSILHEERIVWLTDAVDLPQYVREAFCATSTPCGRPPEARNLPGELVGFAELAPDAPDMGCPGVYFRRIFWLKASDPYSSDVPTEAVDPLTVRPRVRGTLTQSTQEEGYPGGRTGMGLAAAPALDMDCDEFVAACRRDRRLRRARRRV